MSRLWAAVELGGTKVVAAVGRDPLEPLEVERIPTRDPKRTLEAVADFFAGAAQRFGVPGALGIAAFGPIDIRRGSPTFGHLKGTPKDGWGDTDIAGVLAAKLGCPVALDTDVNAAAMAEARWGAAQGLGTMVYLTVGTGIGGGIVVESKPIHGALHPEIGHLRLKRHSDDPLPSLCRFHEDCAEGLASGPAILSRFGRTLGELGPGHPFRAILADYLGQLCASLVLVVSPERIVIGGGVMTGGEIHEEVRKAMRRWLNGYAEPDVAKHEGFIVPPGLGDHAGISGAFALALDLVETGA